MRLEFPWYFLLLPVLALLYGRAECRVLSRLGLSTGGRGTRAAVSLAGSALILAWLTAAFPLALFLLFAYLLRGVRILVERPRRQKHWFLLNLGYVNILALLLVFIAAAALATERTMAALLDLPFWRAASLAAVLAAVLAEDLLLLQWRRFTAALAVVSESEEARPFMAFLWFSTGYLLLDSLLCSADLEPLYPPLFLVGSSSVLIFLQILFLLRIHAIIRREHLREEHRMLTARLSAARKSSDSLKRLADHDGLTGAFSRRFAMEQIEALAEAGVLFSVAFLDVDGLKRLNDSQGHEAGDRYLSHFAASVRTRLRDGDLLARVGGDEFVVLMPNCGGDTAARRIGAIRSQLEADADPASRFSFGVASHRPGAQMGAVALLGEADRAMYLDKAHRP